MREVDRHKIKDATFDFQAEVRMQACPIEVMEAIIHQSYWVSSISKLIERCLIPIARLLST